MIREDSLVNMQLVTMTVPNIQGTHYEYHFPHYDTCKRLVVLS